MPRPKLSPFWLLPLLLSHLAAQQIDTASGPRTVSVFEEISDPAERSLFQELWDTEDPQLGRQRAVAFVERYPRSVALREAYEQAARASAVLGDNDGGIEWGRRALRLLPENPFLQAMVADLAEKQGQHQLAETSARQALLLMERAQAPASIPPNAWPQVRDGVRELADFALGRSAAAQGHYEAAERWLVDALRLKPDDYEAMYALAVARYAAKDEESAAPCFAQLMNSAPGALSVAGRQWLQRVYAAKPRSQTFAEFAAARHCNVPPAAPTPPSPPPGDYAGSAACSQCHADEFSNWKASGMSKMFRPYAEADVMGRFSGEEILGGSARAGADGGRRFIELRDADSGKWTHYPVDGLIGSKWQQAYASKLPDGQLVVLPIQYSKLEGWVNYWKTVDGSSARSDLQHFRGTPYGSLYQRDCAPCHTSQLRYDSATSSPATARFREGGVDCEMCHGPSKAHVDTMMGTAKTWTRSVSGLDPPVDFTKISAQQSLAICEQCHMQSAVHDPEANGTVNYSQTNPFYRTYTVHLLTDFTRKAFYSDGRFRATTFIGEALERSRCFLEGGATCASCHNPHAANASSNLKSLRFGPDSDEMCLQCHKALRDHPERHTRHAPASEASRCVSCHMPRNMEALMFPARSHQIDEIPDADMTARFGQADSPNACLACHTDRDSRWLLDRMASWLPAPLPRQ